MASATAVEPPTTDPDYRKPLEPSGPLSRTASAAVDADAAAASGTVAGGGSGGKARRISVILHGKRADETDVRGAVAALRAEGVRVDVKVTWESGDVEKFVKDIVRAHSTDTIVAAGGDGTLNEVVAALIKVRAPRNIAVGLMPMGTSNDFAAVTGIPQDLEGALRLCCRSDNLRPLDVGLLNGEVFMNTATLGASSELGSETSHEAKKLLGPAAYLVKGFTRLAGYTAVPVRMRFPTPEEVAPPSPAANTAAATTAAHAPQQQGEKQQRQQSAGGEVGASDDEGARKEAASPSAGGGGKKAAEEGKKTKRKKGTVEMREQVLNLTAGNNRQLASMVQACPDALLDDGLLDITYVTGGAVETATAMMGEILTRGLDDAQPPNVHIMRVPWLELAVEAEDPDLVWPGNRDGEPVPPGRRFLLEALPRRITMHLPDSARVLLTEGADPQVNAPVITLNRLRKGAFKAMLAQVTRFRRIIPGSRPWWQGAALGLLARLPTLVVGFALGYGVGKRGVRHRTDAEDKAGVGVGETDVKQGQQQPRQEQRRRRRIPLPPVWPGVRGQRRGEAVVAAV